MLNPDLMVIYNYVFILDLISVYIKDVCTTRYSQPRTGVPHEPCFTDTECYL